MKRPIMKLGHRTAKHEPKDEQLNKRGKKAKQKLWTEKDFIISKQQEATDEPNEGDEKFGDQLSAKDFRKSLRSKQKEESEGNNTPQYQRPKWQREIQEYEKRYQRAKFVQQVLHPTPAIWRPKWIGNMK